MREKETDPVIIEKTVIPKLKRKVSKEQSPLMTEELNAHKYLHSRIPSNAQVQINLSGEMETYTTVLPPEFSLN